MYFRLTNTRQAMDVLFTVKARSFNHRCSGKAIIITYSECVFVALAIQHAMCVMLPSVGCLALQYFFHILS